MAKKEKDIRKFKLISEKNSIFLKKSKTFQKPISSSPVSVTS